MFSKIVSLVVLLVALTSASAFVPATPVMRVPAASSRNTPTMAMKPADLPKAIATVGASIAAAAPAFATEGTSENLGIESPAMLWLPMAVVLGIATLYGQWVGTQDDNDQDFFGEYDSRRN